MTAVEDFSLAIADDPPSITALVGESGSGKTTLARLLLGLIEPSEGAVLYKGADIRTLSGADRQAFRRDVQVIFQDPFEAYNPFYRVDHVLETPVLNFGIAGSRARGAAHDRGDLARRRPAARGDARPLSASTERRASASASWWRARF